MWTITTTVMIEGAPRAAMERVVHERVDSLESLVQEPVRPDVLQRLRTGIAPYVIALGGLLSGLGFGAPVHAQEVPKDATSFTYYVPVVADLDGANDSAWKTLIEGFVKSDETAQIQYQMHPRGVPAGDDDPRSPVYEVYGSSSFTWAEPLGQAGASGAAWVEIVSDQPLGFSSTYVFNQSTDGTQQGQALPVFNAATIIDNQRFLHKGDTATFNLNGWEWEQAPTKRENLIFFVPPESAPLRMSCTTKDRDGYTTNTLDLNAEPGTYFQVPVNSVNFQTEIRPGSRITCRARGNGPSLDDVLAFMTVSKVDNINAEKQDPYTDEGQQYKAIEKAEIFRNSGEVNDAKIDKINH
jgi:hypothetical protein